MTRPLALAALIVVATAGIPCAVRADDAANEATWKRYWMAIDAQRQCTGVAFTQAQLDAMVQVIDRKVNYEVGAGRGHLLMNEASAAVSDMAFKHGCKGPELGELLTLFNSDLAPALR
jgi:hypothetical protein